MTNYERIKDENLQYGINKEKKLQHYHQVKLINVNTLKLRKN